MTVTPRPQAHPLHDSASEGPFSIPEVAELLGNYARTILRLIDEGKLKATRPGGGRAPYRVEAADLTAYVDEYGEHDPRKVAASHPDTLAAFRPESVELVKHQRLGDFPLIEPLRLPDGMAE